jgi:hypothetical protein
VLPAGKEEVEEERVRATFRVRVQREAMKGGLSASAWRGEGGRWGDTGSRYARPRGTVAERDGGQEQPAKGTRGR